MVGSGPNRCDDSATPPKCFFVIGNDSQLTALARPLAANTCETFFSAYSRVETGTSRVHFIGSDSQPKALARH